jgi:tetratricopeptide (TPR) repeat protein
LRDARALHEIGREDAALRGAIAIRADVEATGYKPLVAELLELIGWIQAAVSDAREAEETLHVAFTTAVSVGDDDTAARAAAGLAYAIGYGQGRHEEGKRWVRLGTAVIDHSGRPSLRTRGWLNGNEAAIVAGEGDLATAEALFRKAVSLEESELGPEHPDVAMAITNLGFLLAQERKFAEALEMDDRALTTMEKYGGTLHALASNRGEVLRQLGRNEEAAQAFEQSLLMRQSDRDLAYPLTGLGELKLAGGDAPSAIPLLERAFEIRGHKEPDPTLTAQTQFVLARALSAAGLERRRACTLAWGARRAYASRNRTRQVAEIDAWMAAQSRRCPTR